MRKELEEQECAISKCIVNKHWDIITKELQLSDVCVQRRELMEAPLPQQLSLGGDNRYP